MLVDVIAAHFASIENREIPLAEVLLKLLLILVVEPEGRITLCLFRPTTCLSFRESRSQISLK